MGSTEGKQGVICQKCRVLLDSEFEHVDGQPACDNCAPGLKAEFRARQAASLQLPGGWWTRSILYGGGTSIACALIYAVIVLATGFEPAILAIAIGAAVGMSSRAGAGGMGGVPLQSVAVALVFAAMVSAYAIVAALASSAGALSGLTGEIEGFRSQFGGGAGLFAFAVSRPFMSGAVGLISLVLGFFAAWRFCAGGRAGAAGQDLWQQLANSSKD